MECDVDDDDANKEEVYYPLKIKYLEKSEEITIRDN